MRRYARTHTSQALHVIHSHLEDGELVQSPWHCTAGQDHLHQLIHVAIHPLPPPLLHLAVLEPPEGKVGTLPLSASYSVSLSLSLSLPPSLPPFSLPPSLLTLPQCHSFGSPRYLIVRELLVPAGGPSPTRSVLTAGQTPTPGDLSPDTSCAATGTTSRGAALTASMGELGTGQAREVWDTHQRFLGNQPYVQAVHGHHKLLRNRHCLVEGASGWWPQLN